MSAGSLGRFAVAGPWHGETLGGDEEEVERGGQGDGEDESDDDRRVVGDGEAVGDLLPEATEPDQRGDDAARRNADFSLRQQGLFRSRNIEHRDRPVPHLAADDDAESEDRVRLAIQDERYPWFRPIGWDTPVLDVDDFDSDATFQEILATCAATRSG